MYKTKLDALRRALSIPHFSISFKFLKTRAEELSCPEDVSFPELVIFSCVCVSEV